MSVHLVQELVLFFFTCGVPSLIAQVAVVVDDTVEVTNNKAELLRCVVGSHFDVEVILDLV